tara:strand:- start:914 stop:1885 length:972 start_codon:yes stop_codon:yes gene_type:complete
LDQKVLESRNNKPKILHIICILIFSIFLACGDIQKKERIKIDWNKYNIDLPEGMELFQGTNSSMPLKAWVAIIDLDNKDISVKVLSSSDKDRVETPLEFMEITNARLVINGGYFNASKIPSQHVGLLKTKNILEEPASHSVYRDSKKHYITRGAFGIKQNGMVDIAWCSTKNDSIFQWKRPINNRPGFSNDSIPFSKATHWDVRDAIHAGPVLISDGKIDLTLNDEVFFNTPVAGVQPRTAVGYTKDNNLILMIVDGRQVESRGVYLEELATMMLEFNCIEAINLDGGGSSAMVADSRLVNRPSGRTNQRQVMSAIGVFYNQY